MSLPWAFGTTETTTPANVPYLAANPEIVARWCQAVPHHVKLNVGIVWSGSPEQRYNARRSLPFENLLPILRVRGARFFSLQKGPASAEAGNPSPDINLTALGPESGELRRHRRRTESTRSSDLDMYVGAASAGALGKPVWLLLSDPADYRWLKDRNDTPWYPTMRLYRQERAGNWDDVIRRVQIDLQGLTELKAGGATERAIADAAAPRHHAHIARAAEPDSARIPAGGCYALPHPRRLDAMRSGTRGRGAIDSLVR